MPKKQLDERRWAADGSQASCWLLRARDGARDGLSCSRSPLDAASRPLGSCATASSHMQVPPPRLSHGSRSPRQPAPPSLKPSSHMVLPRPRRRNIRDVAYDHWRAGCVDMASMAIVIAHPACRTGGCEACDIKRGREMPSLALSRPLSLVPLSRTAQPPTAAPREALYEGALHA